MLHKPTSVFTKKRSWATKNTLFLPIHYKQTEVRMPYVHIKIFLFKNVLEEPSANVLLYEQSAIVLKEVV